MRLVIFGAAGRTGQRLVEYALEAGHGVRAFARDPRKLAAHAAHPQLELFEGDARDSVLVERAINGADAVLSALGVDNFRDPGTFLHDAMAHITRAMHVHDVKRVLAVAGAGILDATVGGGLRQEQPTFPEVFRAISAAHKGTWEALKTSDTTWTLVCTPDLIDGPRGSGTVLEADSVLPKSTNRIAVGDVADWMLREMTACRYPCKRVGLCY